MRTIGEQLDEHRGVGPGFDAVRLILATSVLFIHTSLIAPGVVGAENAPLFAGAPVDRWAFNFAAVPMFFALSGFLVAASAERLSIGQFLINRLLRVVPALGVEITLSALVLGPLVTSLALGGYFTDGRFFSYFLNIFGLVHYELPGVFDTNPQPNIVNGAIWTVPHELACYAMVAALVAVGVYRRLSLLTLATVGLFAVAIAVFASGAYGFHFPGQAKLEYIFVTRGAARLMPMFLVGMLVYRYRYAIPFRADFAVGAFVLYLAIASAGDPSWSQNPIFNAAVAPLMAYVVVYCGLSPAFRLKALKGGDYSYGIYLYGFPVQQAILHVAPGVTSVPLFFALSLAAVVPIAVLSWTFVERPILSLRRRYSVAARMHVGPEAEAAQAKPGREIGRREGAAAA